MRAIEVYADVACPFAHVALRSFVNHRRERGFAQPLLKVRPWPLELVNEAPHDPAHLAEEIAALRDGPGHGLFAGFDSGRFPGSTRLALAAEVAATRVGADTGERFSLAVRDALFERGLDVADPAIVRRVCEEVGTPFPGEDEEAAVPASLATGRRRGVKGSPHFFTEEGDFFCPSLDIRNEGEAMEVDFDAEGFARLAAAAFG